MSTEGPAARWEAAQAAVDARPEDRDTRLAAARLGALQGRHAAVVALLVPLLGAPAVDREAWQRWAAAQAARGQGATAVQQLQARLVAAGGQGPLAAVLGGLLVALGRAAQALPVCSRALAGGEDALLWAVLGEALQAKGQAREAGAALDQLRRRWPAAVLGAQDPAAAVAGARLALALGQDEAAEALLDALLSGAAPPLEAWLLRARRAVGQGRLAEARRELVAATAAWPDAATAWAHLAMIEAQLGRIHAARAAFGRLPADPPPALRRQRAVFEATNGDPQRAVAELEALVATLGPRPVLLQDLAHALGRAGAHARVRALLGPLVGQGALGANALAAWGVAMRRTGAAADAAGPLRDAIARHPGPSARQLLLHTLGDCLHAAGDTDGAFAAHRAAHAVLRLRFPPHGMEAHAAEVVRRFPAARLRAVAPARDDRGLPGTGVVFVLGMPRSGTSMVEQILAAHPAGAGAGEPPFLGEAIGHGGALGELDHLAALLEEAPAARAARGRAYEARLCAAAGLAVERPPPGGVVVDKLPGNFLHIGAIALVLPGARVVHTRRDPLDTCLSCYFQNFTQAYAPFTRLDTLGWFYRGYAALMDHWRAAALVPMLELDYERTVADLEGEVARLLAFVGLPLRPEALAFHESRRAMPTASYDQVRQPVYKSSVGRAARYAAHLGPLVAALGDRLPGGGPEAGGPAD